MCDPVSAVIGIGAALVGSQMMQAPSIPAPATPAAAPQSQASQSPDTQAVRAGQSSTGQAGGAPGVAQTFLTGAGGIDPDTLKLGKSTLLGS